MLAIPPGKDCYVGVCDKCGKTLEHDETKYDDAAFDQKRLGWLEMPRTGKKRELWPWFCETCKPPGSGGFMPSTPSSGPVSD